MHGWAIIRSALAHRENAGFPRASLPQGCTGLYSHLQASCAVAGVVIVSLAFLSGCAQQADLLQTEKTLQKRIKQQDDQFSQARARQGQEISALREQELPQLRGDLERVSHQVGDLQTRQEDLKHRLAQLEQQTKKLEQLAAKMDADNTTRHVWFQKSLDNQDAKVAARLDDISKAMEAAMAGLKKDIVEVVQRTNDGLAKRVDVKLDEQQRGLVENQHRLEQVSQKVTQFQQALTGFKEALMGLNDRVGQEEQNSKALAARIDADAKTSSAHASEVNKSVTSVAKALESVGQKVTARFDEQDRRIESIEKAVGQFIHNSGARQQPTKQAQGSVPVPIGDSGGSDRVEVETSAEPADHGDAETPSAQTRSTAPQAPAAVESAQSNAEPSDKARYEYLLALFREGDLEGARQGFAAFLLEYPNSDLAPNARFWEGESYYGKKEFRKAIDSYDKVELDYPKSEKVPAAILKKGYSYLALKDRKRASTAFKQVVTLYPRSPEAGKASDKLAQLKEVR
jgi:tol-pal system protein YbgF